MTTPRDRTELRPGLVIRSRHSAYRIDSIAGQYVWATPLWGDYLPKSRIGKSRQFDRRTVEDWAASPFSVTEGPQP